MDFEKRLIGECLVAANHRVNEDAISIERAKLETPLMADAIEATTNIRTNYARGVIDGIGLMLLKPGEEVPDRLARLIESYREEATRESGNDPVAKS